MEKVISLEAIRGARDKARSMIEEGNRLKSEGELMLRDAEAAERLIFLLFDLAPPETQSGESPSMFPEISQQASTKSGNPYRPKTVKALIWDVLNKSQNRWLTAVEIKRIASQIKGQDIPMASISPLLSDMKGNGIILRNDMRVALASRLNENGGPNSPPDADDVDASSNT